MRIRLSLLACAFAGLVLSVTVRSARAQTQANATEIPLQHCDRLPIVIHGRKPQNHLLGVSLHRHSGWRLHR
jgi:hypothetical protein